MVPLRRLRCLACAPDGQLLLNQLNHMPSESMELGASDGARTCAVDDRVRDVYYANRPVVGGERALMTSAAAAARGNANGPLTDRP